LAWLVGVASSNSYSDRSVFAPDFSVLALLVGVASSKFETYSDCSVFALLAPDFSVAAADFSVLAWLVGVASSNSYSDRSVFAPDFSVLALLVGVASSKFETYSDCSVFALLAADLPDLSVLAWLVGVADVPDLGDLVSNATDFSVFALTGEITALALGDVAPGVSNVPGAARVEAGAALALARVDVEDAGARTSSFVRSFAAFFFEFALLLFAFGFATG